MVKDKYVTVFSAPSPFPQWVTARTRSERKFKGYQWKKRKVSKKLKLLCPGQQKKAAVSFSFFDKKMETKCITATAFWAFAGIQKEIHDHILKCRFCK